MTKRMRNTAIDVAMAIATIRRRDIITIIHSALFTVRKSHLKISMSSVLLCLFSLVGPVCVDLCGPVWTCVDLPHRRDQSTIMISLLCNIAYTTRAFLRHSRHF
jgi:hypothetical protein